MGTHPPTQLSYNVLEIINLDWRWLNRQNVNTEHITKQMTKCIKSFFEEKNYCSGFLKWNLSLDERIVLNSQACIKLFCHTLRWHEDLSHKIIRPISGSKNACTAWQDDSPLWGYSSKNACTAWQDDSPLWGYSSKNTCTAWQDDSPLCDFHTLILCILIEMTSQWLDAAVQILHFAAKI